MRLNIKWYKLPYVLLLVLFWFATKMCGVNMTAGSPLGVTLILTCVVIIVIELSKSMDIGTGSFKRDLAFSIFTTVLTTALIARYVNLENLCLVDVFMATTVLIDAYLSPVCSFAMALRNLSGNVGTKENEEAL
jgi:hypothetical protein